ncbi:uncharacterized protein [Periplaneta americana]|uniref:uncharacterized protein n=1 Tax=Periplaneta americana TaxID=6978 RepID=UPI0037E95F19
MADSISNGARVFAKAILFDADESNPWSKPVFGDTWSESVCEGTVLKRTFPTRELQQIPHSSGKATLCGTLHSEIVLTKHGMLQHDVPALTSHDCMRRFEENGSYVDLRPPYYQ